MNQRSLWCLKLSGRETASNRTAPLEPTIYRYFIGYLRYYCDLIGSYMSLLNKISIWAVRLTKKIYILKVPKCTYDKANVIFIYRLKTPDYIRLQHQPPWTISVYDCNSNHPGQLAYVIVRISVKNFDLTVDFLEFKIRFLGV